MTWISPGSTMRWRSRPVNEVRSAWTSNATTADSPGSSQTLAYAVSCLIGRVTSATGSAR